MSHTDVFDHEDYGRRTRAAKEVWANGGTAKDVASVLGNSAESARKHIKRWERDRMSGRIDEAVDILLRRNFSPKEVSVICDVPIYKTEMHLKRATVADRAKSLPHGSKHLAEDAADLEVSARAANVIKATGVVTIADLCNLTQSDLKSQKGCGATTLAEIIAALDALGLSLSG
jgi:hypothetical protein